MSFCKWGNLSPMGIKITYLRCWCTQSLYAAHSSMASVSFFRRSGKKRTNGGPFNKHSLKIKFESPASNSWGSICPPKTSRGSVRFLPNRRDPPKRCHMDAVRRLKFGCSIILPSGYTVLWQALSHWMEALCDVVQEVMMLKTSFALWMWGCVG